MPTFQRLVAALVVAASVGNASAQGIPVIDVANLLQAVTMDTLQRWAAGSESGAELGRRLQRRTQLVLSGATVVYGWGAADRTN